MRLQGVGIIFALIVLPIILVMSYYIQLEVDTLSLQKSYDSKLLDSTYDAMSAFEINTANEDLSTVSDSLRTIVEASSNVFITTLATNMGMSNASKSMIEPYIPAILFTMYDARTNLSTQVVENVKSHLSQHIYKTMIPRNIRLAEAPSYGMPISLYDPKSSGAESYMALAEEVIARKDI